MSDIIQMNLDDVCYHVLPSKRLAGSSFADLHDKVFNFFVGRWEEAFEDTKDHGKPAPGWEDHFLKQDMIAAITYRGEVIAAHLYTVYDLSAASTQKSECFSFISKETIKGLLLKGVRNVISMEYLCVDSRVKRNSLGISFGKVIAGLGCYLTEDKGIDGAIGTPIKGNKVDAMMENMGGFPIQTNFEKYGYMVDLLFIPTNPSEEGRDLKAREVMQALWARRFDYTSEYYSKLAA